MREADTDEGNYGPKMQELNPRQRAFVLAALTTGKYAPALWAKMAGYRGDDNVLAVTGHRLAHDKAVQEAMHEESVRRLASGKIYAVSVLLDLCTTADKDSVRLKAAEAILNRSGLHERTEHKTTVEHTISDRAMIDRIKVLAGRLGLDPVKLLGSAGVPVEEPVDAEFEEVPSSTEGLEDVL